MQDPTNPNGNWQDVPTTPPAGAPPAGSYVPPPAGAYQPPPPGYQPPPPGYQPPPTGLPPAAGGMSPNSAAAVAYLTFIPAVIFLVTEPYKRIPLVKFHAIQCLGLTVVYVVVSIILGVIAIPLAFTGMYTTIHLIFMLIRLLFFIAWLAAIIQASQGKFFKLPVIGDFALKQTQTP